jgi:hypothetical protein
MILSFYHHHSVLYIVIAMGDSGSASSGKGNASRSFLYPRTITLSSSASAVEEEKCMNCGVTQTPLWRRGFNDELNCNACGLYFKQVGDCKCYV